MTEDEGFLQRWSRRKQASVHEDEAADADADESESESSGSQHETVKDDTAQPADADLGLQDESEVAAQEPEPPGDEDMPPLESIDQGGSVTPFMSPRVSEGLRRAALRRLFSQPKYNVVDMLDDYAEDYSKPVALGDIVTSDMRYRAEQAAKRMKEKLKESLAEKDAGDAEVPDGDIAASSSADRSLDDASAETSGVEGDRIVDTGDVETPTEDSSEDPNQKPA
ncbi:MAG TPA: DUF3306 domain-containing protein [Wenzhouxiangella sp.]|nr:DUF3306 domain-containing protein [Wenzhouxiangella sp.]